MQIKEWSYVYVLELSCVPVRPNETAYIIFTVRKVGHRWSGKLVALSQIVNLSPRQYALDAPETSKALCSFVSRLLESDARRFFIEYVNSPKLLDTQGNEIERPSLIKKEAEQRFWCWVYSELPTQISYFESSSHSAGLETPFWHECELICNIDWQVLETEDSIDSE